MSPLFYRKIVVLITLLITLSVTFLLVERRSEAAPLAPMGQVTSGGPVQPSFRDSGGHQAVSRDISLLTLIPTQIEPLNVFTDPLTYTLYLPAVMKPTVQQTVEPGDCLSAEEFELVNLINQYRNENGLADVPVSKSLTQVAQWHVIDLHENEPDTGSDHGLACNMHSWSDQGVWSPVCYTSDHAFASGMWDKPREITSNVYTGNGYENAYGSSGQATATGAFNGWKNSSAHNAVILETDIWSGSNWPAMGVGIYQHHAVLWFGDNADPQGTVTETCDVYEGRPQ